MFQKDNEEKICQTELILKDLMLSERFLNRITLGAVLEGIEIKDVKYLHSDQSRIKMHNYQMVKARSTLPIM